MQIPLIHGREIVHRGYKHIDFDYVFQFGAAGFEDCVQVFEGLDLSSLSVWKGFGKEWKGLAVQFCL